jgi:hypothetical protein
MMNLRNISWGRRVWSNDLQPPSNLNRVGCALKRWPLLADSRYVDKCSSELGKPLGSPEKSLCVTDF